MIHRVELRPLMADVDAMGVVYYGRYPAFFELGRAELMRQAGMNYAQLMEQELNLPVSELQVRYRKSALYDELLTVETRLAWLKKVSMGFSYRLLAMRDGREEELALGQTSHGCVTDSGRIAPLPASLVRMLQPWLD